MEENKTQKDLVMEERTRRAAHRNNVEAQSHLRRAEIGGTARERFDYH